MTSPTTLKPKRIQRRRSHGWRMPEGAVYVGRPTIFGNPFSTAAEYHEWLKGCAHGLSRWQRDRVRERIHELRGKDLACWCPLDQPCHASVLLEIANSEGLSR